MISNLFSSVFVFGIALLGTAVGNVLRVILIPKQRKRYTRPNTNELIITGVVSNGVIAALIAMLTGGRRFWGAFVGGVVLTLILGDRMEQEPFGLPISMKKSSSNGTSQSVEDVTDIGTPEVV